MRLQILKHIGAVGMLLDYKTLIPDIVNIDVSEEGVLCIGNKTYAVTDGKVRFPEYELVPGPSKVTFVGKDGTNYVCGTINRNSRFMTVTNPIDSLAVSIALMCEAQGERIDALERAVDEIRQQYGISII